MSYEWIHTLFVACSFDLGALGAITVQKIPFRRLFAFLNPRAALKCRSTSEGYLGLQYCNTVQYNTIQYNTIHAVVKWLKNGHVTHIANTGDGTLRITSNPVAKASHGTKVVPRATVLEQTGSDSRQEKTGKTLATLIHTASVPVPQDVRGPNHGPVNLHAQQPKFNYQVTFKNFASS